MKTLMITLALASTSISFAKGHDNNPVMKETVKKWMHHHLKYPNKAIREKKEGIVFVSFVIDENGKVNEAQIIQGVSEEIDAEAICISIDKEQYHVVNHLNGQEMDESRNMLIESARIARGNIQDINNIDPADIDALVIPGGFGSAKNFTKWAFSGPEGDILPEVKLLLVNMINIGKPIAALCVSPVVMAKALEGSSINPNLTIGSKNDPSPYDIEEFSKGLQSVGMRTENKSVQEILVDRNNKIITAPCYMMEANIVEIRENIRSAVHALKELI